MARGGTRRDARGRPTVESAGAAPSALIISYPKSGRTWLRVLIGKALCLQHGLSPRLLLDTPELTSAAGVARTDFDHDQSSLRHPLPYTSLSENKLAYRGKKVILLVRDPRDVLVSSFYEVTRRSLVFERDTCGFEGTIADFVRSPLFGASKLAAFYEIWSRSLRVPEDFLLIRYEELHDAPTEVLRSVLGFIGAERVGERNVAAAVAYASFANMRKLEHANAFGDPLLRPGDAADPDSYKVRRGEVGGYVRDLSAADIAYIDAEMQRRGSPFAEPVEARWSETSR